MKKLNVSLFLLLFFLVPGLAYGAIGDINTSTYIQARYTLSASSNDSFTIPRLRSDIFGSISDYASYLVELDAVVSPAIIYGWIDLKPNSTTKLRVGRFYYPFGLEYTTPPSKFDTINPTYTLWNCFGYSRDTGIQLSQNFSWLKYDLALVNGADNQTTDDNESKDIVGRVVFKHLKDINYGFSVHVGKAGSLEAARQRIGAELSGTFGFLGVKAEYIRITDSGVKKWGWYLQPSVWLSPVWQALVRYEYWDVNTQATGDLQTVTTLGTNLLLEDNLKLQVNYEAKREEAEISNDALLTQLQIKF